MVKLYPEMSNLRFPHMIYGTKPDSNTAKNSYPVSFKRYFFKMSKSFIKTDKGMRRLKNPPTTFIIPGGKRCTLHEFGCPEDC